MTPEEIDQVTTRHQQAAGEIIHYATIFVQRAADDGLNPADTLSTLLSSIVVSHIVNAAHGAMGKSIDKYVADVFRDAVIDVAVFLGEQGAAGKVVQ